jgi:hypothetical protein
LGIHFAGYGGNKGGKGEKEKDKTRVVIREDSS